MGRDDRPAARPKNGREAYSPAGSKCNEVGCGPTPESAGPERGRVGYPAGPPNWRVRACILVREFLPILKDVKVRGFTLAEPFAKSVSL
jgi:hypothetical protein